MPKFDFFKEFIPSSKGASNTSYVGCTLDTARGTSETAKGATAYAKGATANTSNATSATGAIANTSSAEGAKTNRFNDNNGVIESSITPSKSENVVQKPETVDNSVVDKELKVQAPSQESDTYTTAKQSDSTKKSHFNSSKKKIFEDPINGDFAMNDQKRLSPEEIEDGKALAVLAYLPFLCFIPYVRAKGKNSFAYQHGKQGVLLFLFEVIVVLVILSWKVAILLAAIAALAGIIYALMGRLWKVPYIGVLADKLDQTHLFDEWGETE